MKYFAGVKTVEELRKKYRELLKKYHPDNENGSVEVTQEINVEYDLVFSILSKEEHSDSQSAYSARTAHPFRRNGAPFRFKLSKAQLVD